MFYLLNKQVINISASWDSQNIHFWSLGVINEMHTANVKEGNKGSTMIRIFFNSPIFSNVKCTYYKSDKYRTVKKNSYHR